MVSNIKTDRKRASRHGAVTVEFAVVGSLTLLLLIGFAVLSLGVYRYQQVAYLARAGARYAATHGAKYRSDNYLPAGDPAVWTEDIRQNGILPRVSVINPDLMTVDVSWSAGTNAANAADAADAFGSRIPNAVTVTVSYQWMPEAFTMTPITFSSSSTTPMTY